MFTILTTKCLHDKQRLMIIVFWNVMSFVLLVSLQQCRGIN